MKQVIITIGRSFGSGGHELGTTLSQKLGIPCYDKELISQAAQKAGMNPEYFQQNDERVPKFINGALSFSFGLNPMPWYASSSMISDDKLYQAQSDFIQHLTQNGPCIIIGRTADYVLRHLPNVVSVFVHAPEDVCVDRIIGRSDITDRDKAARMAEKINKLRANYYNFYSDKKWGHSTSYDLTLDSSKLSMDDMAELIIDYIERRFK